MTQGHSRMAGQEHQGDRLPHNVAATDHSRVFAFGITTHRIYELHNPHGCAGFETLPTQKEKPLIDRMEPIDILLWRDRLQGSLRADVGRKRKLNKDAMDFFVPI